MLSRNVSSAALLAALALSGAGLARDDSAPPGGVGQTTPFTVPGKPSDAHRLLFTPRAAPPGSYLVNVLAEALPAARDTVTRALGVAPPAAAEGGGPPAGGPWAIRRLEVGEAFGGSGAYEPVRLARLFNGSRAQVCRGPVLRDGRVVASATLISPYPDPDLNHLEPGTLVIVFVVETAKTSPAL